MHSVCSVDTKTPRVKKKREARFQLAKHDVFQVGILLRISVSIL